jgi:hypothetical protein
MEDANVFATAGKIAGLAGLSLAVIVVLLRPIIAANILQGLSVPARERTLRLVIGGAVAVALVGLCSYSFSGWLNSQASQAGLIVGRNADIGGSATLQGKTSIGQDLKVKEDLRVGPANQQDKK